MLSLLLAATYIATATPSNTPTQDDPCAVSAAVTVVPNSTYCSTDFPPERFQHYEQNVAVTFKPTLMGVNLDCNGGKLPERGVILACHRINIFGMHLLTLPDPCLVKDEFYAKLVCHELGHVNGWPATHGD